jgi:hypothetical protein
MTFLRMIAPKTLLFAVLALPSLIVNAYAQQEVDPTWYDPWATTKPAAAQMKTAGKKQAQKVKVAKRTETKPTEFRAAHRSELGKTLVATK